MNEERRFETRAIHAGQEPDVGTGATITPVYQTTTFTQTALGEHRGYEYARGANPTRSALETALASLEGARFGLAYASGMAAIAGVVQTLECGDEIVVADDLYGGSYRLFQEVLPRMGVLARFVDARDLDRVEEAIGERTRMLWLESPTNPMLRLLDIAACVDRAAARGVRTVVDNTFATPYLQRPLELGADVVVHSTTKYIGGHSDVIGGAAVTNDADLAADLTRLRNTTGGVPGPWDAWLTLRGLKTLAVRMRQHEENAAAVAAFLERHPKVARTHYPGLTEHPGHALARRQMDGFGGMVTVELSGGETAARTLCESTRVFSLAESLGGIESLIGYPWTMSHAAFSESMRRDKGISEAVVRLSIGLEHRDDLCADLEQALAQT
ncbi:MAG: cystathionine gamma-synthase [Myxococcales bacterium]|nr:cystathionine gamma-synthase [Myxococcales bacterium]